jgi:putative flippase GtrA
MTFFKKLWNILEAIVRFFLLKVFRLKLSEDQIQAFLQFVKFGLIGVTSTVISYVLYLVSLLALQKVGCSPKYDYLIAQIIAFVLSVLWSYFWNNRLVFKKDENETRSFWKSLLKCYASYAFTGLFLNTILSYLWVDVIGISKLIAPIINLLVSVPINFFMNKLWAFKTDKKKVDANS